jgi:molybdopterin converting factor small subunit
VSINVRIPTILRTYTQDQSQVTADGSTLTEVIDSLESTFPGIKARVVDEQGALRRFVNIYVAEEDVRFAQGLDTPTPEGTQVSIIPAVAGGCRARENQNESESPAVAGSGSAV